jgi:hypothetical protein
MSQHDDFDRSIARWLDAEARPAATADVLDGALRATSRRRPRPGLLAALGSHWVGDSVGATAGVATLGRTGLRTSLALLLLLLVLALVAGAVLVGARLLQPAPQPAIGEVVLHFQSWRQADSSGLAVTTEREEVAVYADGRLIWDRVVDERVVYLEQRLTPEGVEWLRSRTVSTGLFEHDLVLGLALDPGTMEVRRRDRSVIVAWGRTSKDVPDIDLPDRFVEATPAQAGELTELESFFRDPTAWGLPRDMYRQPEITPFAPTHLVVGYDRARPDLSSLPSPAREIVTSHLEPALSGGCESISIDQAREVVDALVRAGEIAPIDDIWFGFSFDVGRSFVHFRPALPHEVGCP